MHRYRKFGVIVGVGLALLGLTGSQVAVATDGSGGNTHAWLSGVGDDANPCSRTAPCKTLQMAFNKTAQPNGLISVEDPGGFGSPSNTLTNTTFTGGITVDGMPGVSSLVTVVAGLDGLDIAAAPNDVVIIRDFDFDGAHIGLHGINFISGKALYIENSSIQSFTGDAVHVAPSAGGRVVLDNVSIRDNGGNGVNAVGASDLAAVDVTIKNSRIEQNLGAAVLSADYANVTVDGSTLSGNEQGLACVTQSTGNCVINAANNLVSESTTGVLSGRGVPAATGGATVYLSGNTIVANTKALGLTPVPAHGRIISTGDNTVVNNTVPGKPTSTVPKL